MENNMDLYWGIIDYISCASKVEEKRERAEGKYTELSVKERNDMMYFLQDCYNVLNIKQVWDIVCSISGETFTGEQYKDCLAGLLSNGRCLFETIAADPEIIRQYDLSDLKCAGSVVRAVFENCGHIVLDKI